jgi:serum/glucocorticoid-regulated kinase 2
MITDQAVYNILPDDYSDMKRRIPLNLVNGISLSAVSTEFVIHVPDEYDYRYKSDRKEIICDLLAALYRRKTGSRMMVTQVTEPELKDITVTKDERKDMSRDEIMRRKERMRSEQHDSDGEEGKAAASEASAQLDDAGGAEKACLDDFDLLKVIGRGSFGKVMQVRKKSNGKVYAMKILKKDTIVARNQVEHTKTERNVLEYIRHPFIVSLRYAFQTKNKLYFVLDYCAGGELFFHLGKMGKFSEPLAKFYVAEIVLAIEYLVRFAQMMLSACHHFARRILSLFLVA